MNKPKIFICGNFGYKNNQIDGQTVKTRQLKGVLIKKLGESNVAYVDTSYAKSTPFATFKKIKRNVMNCSYLIILPGENGLKVLLPFYIRWKRNFNIDIRYIVIGGWLPQFLNRNKFYLGLCKKLDGIYVETNIMKENLLNIGLNNVSILPNFRQIDFEITKINKIKLPFKLVYIGDISPVSSAHNAFLTFLAEQGLLGFIPLVVFYSYIIYRIYVTFIYFSHQGDIQMAQIGIGLLSYLIASVIASQFYDTMLYFDASWSLIAIATSYAILEPLDLKRSRL